MTTREEELAALEEKINAIRNSEISLDHQLELINELSDSSTAYHNSEMERLNGIRQKIQECDKTDITKMEGLIYSLQGSWADVEYSRELRRQKEERNGNV